MRTFPLLFALTIALSPSAAATGYLVNVGVGSNSIVFGANVFGGSGDTLDVGLFNTQCSDEADVVDVGILNDEGGASCVGQRCEHTEGSDPLASLLAAQLVQPGGEPVPANCTDDGDAVDVGVLNNEGYVSYECNEKKECTETQQGDAGDATDVGALNCEHGDAHDATDVGVLNSEWDDRWDTLDLSILNNEWTEGGDVNGIGLGGSFATGIALDCHLVRIDLPVGPGGPLLGRLLP